MTIDLTKLRAVAACAPCCTAYQNKPMRALDLAVECDPCLRLVVAAVMEDAVLIVQRHVHPLGNRSALETLCDTRSGIAYELREAAKETTQP